MPRLRSLLLAVTPLVAAILLASAPVSAQTAAPTPRDPRAAGPYRGLFGGNGGDPTSRQSLDVTLGLFAGYDDDVSGDASTGGGGGGIDPGNPLAQASSVYYGGNANLTYRRNIVEKLSFIGSGGTSTTYYRDLDSLWATSYDANAGLSWAINRRTRVSGNGSFRFSPFFSFAPFPIPGVPQLVSSPSDVIGLGFDTRVVRQDNYNYATNVTFSRETTKRSTFSADANYNYTDFRQTGDVGYRDTGNWGAGARWSYRLTRDLSSRIGYRYATGDYVLLQGLSPTNNDIHTIDVGVDYSKALSFSRNTKFSFSTGTSGYRSSGNVVADASKGFTFTVIGNARLSHAMGQSWMAALTYDRSLQLVNGFQAPFLTDAVAASLGGFLGSRTMLSFVSGVNWGDYGYGYSAAVSRRTRTLYATPMLQFALSENIAVYGSYFYYRYRFDQGLIPLPDGVTPRQERQGFRIGLTTWIPLLR